MKTTDRSNWLYFNKCKCMPDGGVTAFINNEYRYTEFTEACVLPKMKKNGEYLCVLDSKTHIAAIGNQDQMKYLAHASRKPNFKLAEAFVSDEYKKLA